MLIIETIVEEEWYLIVEPEKQDRYCSFDMMMRIISGKEEKNERN